jgi:addiction module HigA family antidote
MTKPTHPGLYVRDHILPPAISIKEAAKLLGVGRPALSNFLNGNAALSTEMAARFEKVFSADAKKLLKLQADLDEYLQQSVAPNLAVGTYVPSFLKIAARDIAGWADGNIEARSLLAVLLRKLVNSTGQDLSLVDFPGYDQAEKKGWDGRVDAGAATPWIPIAKSGWEFGCDESPKQKADKDFAARVKAIPPAERAELNFVFVTPRIWNGKEKWRKEKEALGEWKSVRAYDASDLEQWLEQSLQAQGWLYEKLGRPAEGVHSLDWQWQEWATVTDPELSTDLFASSVEHFKSSVKTWIENPPSSPLIVCGDSRLEALAFLYCLFEADEPALNKFKDRFLVFSSSAALHRLTTASPTFLPIVFSDEVERELGGAYKNRHTIIVRPRNTVEPKPNVVLGLLPHGPFTKALGEMGINDHLEIENLARQSGYSPTILRRRLAKVPAIRTPRWAARDSAPVRKLIPIMFVGAWHAESKGDCEIMSFLAGDEVEQDVIELLRFDDPPVWSVGRFRGVASKIDAFFAVQASVTQKDLDSFFFVAEIVLSEEDPALELPVDKRAFANIYGKSRDHSKALRDGISETLVLLAVYGNDLFAKRLGLDVRAHVDALIRRLLTPLTPEKLLSQTDNMPLYAEAAPQEFLRIIEEDLKSADPQVHSLLMPAETGVFGSCPRTGLLWALEILAWRPDQLPRVIFILAQLAERKINDNWVNKPGHSLHAIFRSWMPQTAATIEDRKRALEVLAAKYPAIGWEICVAQFGRRHEVGEYSQRPRWRNDASGAGQPVKTWAEITPFVQKALDLALTWPSHDETTLGDLVSNLQGLREEDQENIWDLIDKWAASEKDENRRAALREQIRRFAFVRRIANQGLSGETKDRARKVYDLLMPTDLVTRSHWLFEQQWIQESFDEIGEPEFDYQKRDERISTLRIAALDEIWKTKGFEGIKALLSKSGAASTIGWHLAEGVVDPAQAAMFLEQCLRVQSQDLVERFDQAIRGYLHKVDVDVRANITEKLASVLPAPSLCRYLKCSPFQHATWATVDAIGADMSEGYWREVHPDWLRKDSPDLNEVVDRFLGARRPRAAFFSIHIALDGLETSRLKRLLHEVGTCDFEASGIYRLDTYHLSEALTILQNRAGVTEEEMARLEFLFITVLEHDHRIPNLEKQIGKSPLLFVQILALLYRRQDGGEDPPEWAVKDTERRSGLATAAYRLLENIQRIPGTDASDRIDQDKLRSWLKEAKALCAAYGRAEIGDQTIGKILSVPRVGTDGIWPCEEVRSVLEEYGTPSMATGVQVGIYNSRGAHFRAEGGVLERGLAGKYRSHAQKLSFEHPYVANLLEGIAQGYEREAEMWDSEEAVRRRLGH